jgi:hypothetical protein
LPQRKTFRAVLIKPSHYDDDGYVIQWIRSGLPANSLACVYALVEDCARRGVLGEDVDFEIIPYDETNTVIRVNRIIRDLKRADGGFVGLVGVQSNQFPRASDLARQFRAAGSRSCRTTSRRPRRWASRCSRARPKAAWTACCATSGTASSSRSTTS